MTRGGETKEMDDWKDLKKIFYFIYFSYKFFLLLERGSVQLSYWIILKW